MDISNWLIYLDWKTLGIAILAYWIASSILTRYQLFNTFKRLGIDGPPPSMLYSNIKDINFTNINCLSTIQSWIERYGPVFGFFRGHKPTLVVADLDIIKSVLIRDFNKFIDRPYVKIPSPGPLQNMLINLRGERWKHVRTVMTPTFSSKKMREMAPTINSATDIFISEIDKRAKLGEEFDIYQSFQALTLHVIGECAFALEVDCQRNSNDLFLVNVRAFFNGFNTKLFALFEMIPEIGKFLKILLLGLIKLQSTGPLYWLDGQLKKVIKLRKSSDDTTHKDILQLLLNAGQYEDLKVSQINKRNKTLDMTKVHLTEAEITSQAFVTLIAGYETTANTLAFITHLLTKYPEIQKKVQDEIDNLFPENKVPDYDNIHELQYLDQVIFEALRLYPPVTLFVSRECLEEHQVQGLTIPKGVAVMVPTWNLHHDPKLWTDPEVFDPERFSPENKNDIPQMAYLPFGAGPRNCIGMRFALMEIKMSLAKLLKHYCLKASNNFEVDPELRHFSVLLSPKNGVNIKVILRTHTVDVKE